MRLLLAVTALLAGCVQRSSYPPYGGDDGDDYFPPTEYGCQQDSECSTGSVCARTHECLPTDLVRAVHVIWTVDGQPASATSCTAEPDLGVVFLDDTGYHFGYAPVPCMEGRFNIDKFPTNYLTVRLGPHDREAGWDQTVIDTATGNATFDLASPAP